MERSHEPQPVRYVLVERRIPIASVVRDARLPSYEMARRAFNGDATLTWDEAERIARVLSLPVGALFRTHELRRTPEVTA